VSTDHDEITADLEEEELLAQLRNVTLENVGKGKLSLTSKQIEFKKKGGLFSSPRLEFSVDLSRVYSAEADDSSNSLVLEWLDENGEYRVSRLILPGGDAATNLCQSLYNMLELVRRETELQEQKVRYQAFLWKTAYHIWVVVSLLVQIVQELTREDWDAVDASLSEASETVNALAVDGAMDISDLVHTLAETVASRDASSVLRNVTAAMKAIGTTLHDELPIAEEWKELSQEDSPGLNWRDIRYIFLFAGRYKLLSLWQQLHENKKIDDSLPRLARLSTVLVDKISMEFQPERSSGEEEATSTISSVEATAHNLENALKMNAGIA
jgi:hypothetical protein